MDESRIRVFSSRGGALDGPATIGAEAVYEIAILPAMNDFPDFEVTPLGGMFETTVISDQLLAGLFSADLMIVDLAKSPPGGFFKLGVRHFSQMPTILIGEGGLVLPPDAAGFQFIHCRFEGSPYTTGDRDTVDRPA